MKKVIVSVCWIFLLNVAFTILCTAFMLKFNPTITHGEAYEFGNTYGGYFFLMSVVLIAYLAVTNRLPGARQRI